MKNIREIFNDPDTVCYSLECPSLYIESDVIASLDGKYLLFHKAHEPTPLYILIEKCKSVDFSDIAVLADAFSYHHDLPTFIRSYVKQEGYLFKPLVGDWNGDKLLDERIYYSNLIESYQSILNIKINGDILFKWYKCYDENTNIELSSICAKAGKEVQLYSMALKQIDPLTEYLCYYRIFESLSQNNGKSWIADNIDKISSYDFGNLEIKYSACDYKFETEYYFKLCKERALKRIKDINEDRTLVADYLYHTVRCGIAHGKDANVITYDFNDNLKNVAEDIYIVKLLARIGIEEKI